ncbi:hypothetical protein AQ505_09025 [Pedobacter sp. PACM 27299]|uniref:hypothetical protein n=1 Tax=Pedobacter sp. PACM 27299 TaxID=1727164 RepID=UPI0007064B4A|nr:hypothetical protein [Pedobacter sp. PACM 27299]ALL05623.1 hypothetical protein AQ505_09025 [Pedobacter sp. PACM 27299]
MKRAFKNRTSGGLANPLVHRIALWVLRRQRRLADWLNEKAENLEIRTKRLLLVLFCGVFGSYLLDLLFSAFLN